MTRGLRNNNPGNLRRSNDNWSGLRPAQDDPDYFQFTDPVYGIRALAKVLNTYMTKYNLRTVAGIINRWAPSNENDTSSYITDVAKRLNVDPYDTIGTPDLPDLVSAIIWHENGLNPYSDEQILEGVNLAV